jgi:hypothetical protein
MSKGILPTQNVFFSDKDALDGRLWSGSRSQSESWLPVNKKMVTFQKRTGIFSMIIYSYILNITCKQLMPTEQRLPLVNIETTLTVSEDDRTR